MARAAMAARETWPPGVPLDLAREMNRLTLTIVADTLFGAQVGTGSDTARVQQAITDVMEMFDLVLVPFAEWLVRLPLPRMRRYRAAQQALDTLIYGIIGARRASGEDRGDLLSMLLHAQDTEGSGAMTDRQLRDEVITLFLAGHETTANALTWTWWLLARHPEVEAHLHAELDHVLAGRAPTADDVSHLPYTRAVVAESMRLYPPAWTMGRRVLRDYRWDGHDIPAGALVLMSQWIVHRDPRWWPDPTRFDPEPLARRRWRPAALRLLPLRRRQPGVHRRRVRVERGDRGAGGDRPALAVRARPGASRGAAAAHHVADAARAAGHAGATFRSALNNRRSTTGQTGAAAAGARSGRPRPSPCSSAAASRAGAAGPLRAPTQSAWRRCSRTATRPRWWPTHRAW